MHDEFTSLMSLVLDREATPGQALDLRRHLAGCAACAATWRQWQAVDAHLAAAPVVAPPSYLMAGVAARLAERNAQRQQRRRLVSGLILAWGGTLAALWLAMFVTAAWGYTHPLAAGLALSSAAQLAAGLSGLLGGVESFLRGLGDPALALLSACFVSMTVGLVMLWLWVLVRSGMVRSELGQGSLIVAE